MRVLAVGAIDGRGLEVQVGSTIAVLYMDGCSG